MTEPTENTVEAAREAYPGAGLDDESFERAGAVFDALRLADGYPDRDAIVGLLALAYRDGVRNERSKTHPDALRAALVEALELALYAMGTVHVNQPPARWYNALEKGTDALAAARAALGGAEEEPNV